MKVIAFNGSPRAKGNTHAALEMVVKPLIENGVDVEIIQIGNRTIRGCLACGKCARTKDEKCIIDDDVNELIQKMKDADGIIIGSPVHYSGIAGTMKCFLDRAFYVAGMNGGLFRNKVGASVVAVRRSGGMPTFNGLNHYLNYCEMMMPTSNYWNVIHGTQPGDAKEDAEGSQIMDVLGENFMYMLNLRETDVKVPEKRRKAYTNFIR
jgi:multimeric flavodoxin WrbA